MNRGSSKGVPEYRPYRGGIKSLRVRRGDLRLFCWRDTSDVCVTVRTRPRPLIDSFFATTVQSEEEVRVGTYSLPPSFSSPRASWLHTPTSSTILCLERPFPTSTRPSSDVRPRRLLLTLVNSQVGLESLPVPSYLTLV